MKKNNSNKVKLGASDKIVRGFGYVVITIYALACIFPFLLILGSSFTAEEGDPYGRCTVDSGNSLHWQLMRWSARAVVSGNPICSRSS